MQFHVRVALFRTTHSDNINNGRSTDYRLNNSLPYPAQYGHIFDLWRTASDFVLFKVTRYNYLVTLVLLIVERRLADDSSTETGDKRHTKRQTTRI
jgi:hypothetical protein